MNEQKSQIYKQKAAYKVVVFYRRETNKKSSIFFSRSRFQNNPEKGKNELIEKVYNKKTVESDVKTVLLYNNSTNEIVLKHVNP